MKLSSGSTTGERCVCGAPVYAYRKSVHTYHRDGIQLPRTADGIVDIPAIPMHWVFVCEQGHRLVGPDALLRQATMIDEYGGF